MCVRSSCLGICVLTVSIVGCGGSASPPEPQAPAVAEPAAETNSAETSTPPAATTQPEMPASETSTQTADTPPGDSKQSKAKAAASLPPVAPYELRVDEAVQSKTRELLEGANSNLVPAFRQLAMAFHNHHDVHSHFPGPGSMEKGGPVGLSWRVHLLPFLEQAALYEQFNLDEPWDSAQNKKLLTKMPRVFGNDPLGKTSVHVFTGKTGSFNDGEPLRFRDVIDGSSNTLLVVQAGDDVAEFWTKPGGLEMDFENPTACLGKVGKEVTVATMDGAVHMLPLPSDEFAKLVQPADGERVELPWERMADLNDAEDAVVDRPELEPLPKTFDSKLIAEQAIVAAVIYPRHLFEHPLVTEMVPHTNYSTMSDAEFFYRNTLGDLQRSASQFGLKVEAVDEVRIVIAKHPDPPEPTDRGVSPLAPFSFLVYVKSAVPIDYQQFYEREVQRPGNVKSNEFDGTIWLLDPSGSVSIAFPNEYEMLMTNDFFLTEDAMLADGTGAIASQMRANGNTMVQLAGDLPDNTLQTVSPMITQMVPPAALVLPLLEPIEQFSLAADLADETLLNLKLNTDDSAAAEQLASLLDAQLGSLNSMYQQRRQGILFSTSREMAPILDELFGGMSVKYEGNQVDVAAIRPAELDQFPAAVEPLLTKAKQAAVDARMRNELKQIGLAFHNYHSAWSHFPAVNGSGDAKELHGLSWRVQLLPYLDHAGLYNQFKHDEPWDSAHNKTLIQQMPAIFGNDPDGKTSLHVITGDGAPFQNDQVVRIRDISDGTSNTLMVVRAAPDTADIWTKPGGLKLNEKEPFKTLGTFPEGTDSFSIVLFDGSVRTLSLKLLPKLFLGMMTHNGGEILNQ